VVADLALGGIGPTISTGRCGVVVAVVVTAGGGHEDHGGEEREQPPQGGRGAAMSSGRHSVEPSFGSRTPTGVRLSTPNSTRRVVPQNRARRSVTRTPLAALPGVARRGRSTIAVTRST